MTSTQTRLTEKRKLQEQEASIRNDMSMEFQTQYLGRVFDEDWKTEVDKYSITLRNYRTGKNFSMGFSCGIGLRNDGRIVKPFDVLYCIRADSTQGLSFEDWCNECGYATDSRKALDMYLACQKQTDDFKKVFPSVDLEAYEPLADY